MTHLDVDASKYYLNELRNARSIALANAEGFSEVCQTIERLGKFLVGKQLNGLGKYYSELRKLATGNSSDVKDEFYVIFHRLKNARNDAVHEGAFARNATLLCVEFCDLLESGLMRNMDSVDQFIISSPVLAKLFYSIGEIRRSMLIHGFSYLPVKLLDGVTWKLVADYKIAAHLRNPSTVKDAFLSSSLSLIFDHDNNFLIDPVCVFDGDAKISSLVDKFNGRPILLLKKIHINGHDENELMGIVSPSDLM
jgi:hypothetical protein